MICPAWASNLIYANAYQIWRMYSVSLRSIYGWSKIRNAQPLSVNMDMLLLWVEAVQQSWLGSPAVRLTHASMQLYKTVIGFSRSESIIALAWPAPAYSLLSFTWFCCVSAPYESFSVSASMSYTILPGMHPVVVLLQSRLEQRVL